MVTRSRCGRDGSSLSVFIPSSAATCACTERSYAWRATNEGACGGPARPRANRRDASVVGHSLERGRTAGGSTLVAPQLNPVRAAALVAGNLDVRRRGERKGGRLHPGLGTTARPPPTSRACAAGPEPAAGGRGR